MNELSLTDRQKREISYHREFAHRHADKVTSPVARDVLENTRRWWNAYWCTYDILLDMDLDGKRVLVPGCGFGDDAARLALLGAEVFAFDISAEIVQVAQQRCRKFGYGRIHFCVGAAESLPFADSFFDLVFCLDILHHVDIPASVNELKRVAAPGCAIVGDELYTHGFLQRHIRESALVEKVLYPLMVKRIYRSQDPYITPDEHKIDEREFDVLAAILEEQRTQYFNMFTGRLFADSGGVLVKMDRVLMRMLGGFGRYVAGRVVFIAQIKS